MSKKSQNTDASATQKKKKKDKRYTTHRIKRSYEYDSHDALGNFNGLTREAWMKRILDEWSPSALKAEHVSIVFHDNDVDDEGNLKGLHAHAVVHYANKDRRTSSAVCKLAKCTREQDCDGVDKPVEAYRYLIHATENAINDGKHVYDEDSVTVLKADGIEFSYSKAIRRDYEKVDKKKANDAMSTFLEEVSKGKLTLDEVREIYLNDTENLGWDIRRWYADKRMYEEAEKEFLLAMQRWYSTHHRCLTNIYMQGDGEEGKTDRAMAYAKRHCDKRGVHIVAAPGRSTTYDPVGKYHGEKVSIFNEVNGGAFSEEQFNSMFDPIHAGDVNSRNVDKAWFAELAIFTNSIGLEDFIEHVLGDPHHDLHYKGSNKVYQVRRRFAVKVILSSYEQEFYGCGEPGCTEDDNSYEDSYIEDACYKEKVRQAYVYVRDNSDESFVTHPEWERHVGRRLLDQGEPFKLFAVWFSNIPGADLMDIMDRAVENYYVRNGYSVTPWTVEKPPFLPHSGTIFRPPYGAAEPACPHVGAEGQ